MQEVDLRQVEARGDDNEFVPNSPSIFNDGQMEDQVLIASSISFFKK